MPSEADGGADGGSTEDGGKPDGAVLSDGSTTDGSTTDGSTTDGSTTDGSTTDGGPRITHPVWFESKEPLHLKVTGNLGDAFIAAFAGTPDGIVPPVRNKDPFPGILAYPFLDDSMHTDAVTLAVRGNSSLQECAFPKLKLELSTRSDVALDTFFDTRKLKIGTHCGEEDTVNGSIGRLRNEKATWREEAAYQLARALGIVTLQTRPAVVEYTDTSTVPAFASPLTRNAFLLEHVDELAKRLGATALKDPADCGPDPGARPHRLDVLRVKFFHAMIGNWDWAVGPPATDGCGSLWNTEVLTHPDGTLTLVPADFDLAAFVVGEVRDPDTNQFVTITLDNAKVSARTYLTPSLDGETKEDVAAMKAEYLGKQQALNAVLDASAVDAEGKQAGKLLLEGFFAVLAE